MRGRRPLTELSELAPRTRWRLVFVVHLFWTTTAAAQTDYFNTDGGRPLRIHDAYPMEQYAFELQAVPLTLERRSGGHYAWSFEPGLAYGLARSFEVEASAHLRVADDQDGTALRLGGIEIAGMHNLNLETRTLPAFAVGLSAVLPVGSVGPERIHPEVTGMATRSFRWGRMHVNGSYAFGRADGSEHAAHLNRWMGGVAVDRAFPLSGLLLMADVLAGQPLEPGATVEWIVEVGARYQLDPTVVLDIGLSKRLDGPGPSWALTMGAAHVFGIRWLSSPTRESR